MYKWGLDHHLSERVNFYDITISYITKYRFVIMLDVCRYYDVGI